MPPQSRELNDRFKAHIAHAERVRRIVVGALVATCLVGGSGVAFAMVAPPGSSARAALTNQLAAAGAAASSLSWIGDWLFGIFGREETPPPTAWEDTAAPVRSPAPTPTPTARVEQASSTTIVAAPTVPLRQPPAPPAPPQPIQQTIVNQPVIERIVERVVAPAGVSEAGLNLRLADLTTLLRAEFSRPQVSYSGASAPVSTQTFAQSQRIDSLSGVEISGGTITNTAISGGSISGTTISGTISAAIDTAVALINDLTSNRITATNVIFINSTTTNATTTNLYVSGETKLGTGTGVLTSTSGVVTPLTNGANGLVLKIVGGVPSWAADISGSGGGSSAWATTSDDLAVYPADTTDVLLVGNNATSTTGNILEVAGNSLFRGELTAYNLLTASRFTATSSQASQFPYASSTALTVSGTAYIGSLNGPLDARNGVVGATSSIGVLYGGTGLTSAPTYGQLLLGNSSNGYTLSATSSLGLESPLTFSSPLSRIGNTVSISTAGDWSGTLGGFSAAQLIAAGYSTTSANYWQTTRSFFSTTSSDYWETQQTARSADDLTNNSIEDLNDVAAITENFGDLFAWNGSAWTDFATSTLAIALSDTTGTLGATRGGTGLSSVSAAGILLGNYAGTGWQQLATSTLGLLSTNVAEGGNLYYTNARVQTYLDAIDKGFFFSTTSAAYFASQNQDASFSTTSATYFAHSSTTIPKTYTSNIFTGSNIFSGTLTLGSLNGPLQANAGVLSATTSIGVLYGGTGLTSAPTYGQMLVGNSSGGYTLTATSSLGITGGSATFGKTFEMGTNVFSQSMLSPTTTLNLHISGTGTSTFSGGLEAWRQIAAPYFHATSSSATTTLSGMLAVGSNALNVLANGNVGIGTASPSAKLHVLTTDVVAAIFEGDDHSAIEITGTAGNERSIRFLNGSTLQWLLGLDNAPTGDVANFSIKRDNNAAANFTINTAGNVGIGTTTPNSLLNVAGAAAKFTLTDTSAGSNLKHWFLQSVGGLFKLATTSDALSDTAISPFTVSGTGFGTTTLSGLTISGSATSTSNVGFNLSSGCFAINGTCLSTGGSSFAYPFPSDATTTKLTFSGGLLSLASTTIGNGTQAGGLTISGGATTTGNAYFGGNVGIGTANPGAHLSMLHVSGDAVKITTPSDYELFKITETGGLISLGGGFRPDLTSSDEHIVIRPDLNFIGMMSDHQLVWRSAASGNFFSVGSTDTGLTRQSAGVLKITDGAAGNGGLLALASSTIGNGTQTGGLTISGGATTTGNAYFGGNVGIGTTSPVRQLDLWSGTLAAPNVAQLVISNFADLGGSAGIAFKQTNNTNPGNNGVKTGIFATGSGDWGRSDLNFVLNNTADASDLNIANDTKLVIKSDGNVGVATTSPWRKLSVTGTVGFDGLTGATGAGSLCLDSNKQVVYNSASDACLSSTRTTKHDISPLVVDALEQVLALQPVSFVYNEGNGRTRYGFIAEDAAAVDPHLATYDASSTVSGIDDRSIIAILVGAIKDLYAKVQEYFARTERLEERVTALEAQLAASAAAGTPAQGGSGGAPDGSPAPMEASADNPTPTTPAESEPITSAAPPPSTSEAANDNQPLADDENEPQAQDAAPDPAPVLEASNDNTPPPSAEAI